jgi:hypothetical protein
LTDIDAEFWRLVDDVNRADEEFIHAPKQEPNLLGVLEFVRSNPAHREEFVSFFVELALQRRPASHYLVPFCMRTLRYPEVLAAVEEAIARGQMSFSPQRQWPRLFDVRDAYQESWPEADFWQFYAHEVPPPEESGFWRTLARRITKRCSRTSPRP